MWKQSCRGLTDEVVGASPESHAPALVDMSLDHAMIWGLLQRIPHHTHNMHRAATLPSPGGARAVPGLLAAGVICGCTPGGHALVSACGPACCHGTCHGRQK